MAKKKATGLSKRESYLDRNVIAENKAIMRYNESLQDEARRERGASAADGSVDERPARAPTGRPRPDRPAGHGARDDGPRGDGAGGGRPARDGARPRPERAPAVSPEQETALRSAVATAAGESPQLVAAGTRLVDCLKEGRRLERAAHEGWQAYSSLPEGEDRDDAEWDRMRLSWAELRDAVTAVVAETDPQAAAGGSFADAVRKAQAAKQKAARPRRRRPRAPGEESSPPSGSDGEPTTEVGEDASAADSSEVTPGRKRRRRGGRGRGASATPTDPSAHDVRTAVEGTGDPGTPTSQGDEPPSEPDGTEHPPTEPTPDDEAPGEPVAKVRAVLGAVVSRGLHALAGLPGLGHGTDDQTPADQKGVPEQKETVHSDQPSTDRPSTDRPSTDRPSTDRPSTDRPSNDQPSNDQPFVDLAATDSTQSAQLSEPEQTEADGTEQPPAEPVAVDPTPADPTPADPTPADQAPTEQLSPTEEPQTAAAPVGEPASEADSTVQGAHDDERVSHERSYEPPAPGTDAPLSTTDLESQPEHRKPPEVPAPPSEQGSAPSVEGSSSGEPSEVRQQP